MAQVGNLICTGTSRFLNKIYGACTDGSVISSQTQNTKFLRQDGTWAAPSYTTNTDYRVKQTNLSPIASTYYTIPFSKTCNTTEETDSLYKVQDLRVAFDGPDRLASIKLSNSATSSYKFSQYAAGGMALYQSLTSTDPPTAFMAITPSDITVTSYAQGADNTWDGTNTSLKSALAAKLPKSDVRNYNLGYNSTTKKMSLSYTIGSSETVVSTVTCGYASTAGALTTDAGHMSQPVYFSSGVPTKCGGIVFNRNIEGNGSHLIQTCDRVIVFAFRGGSTTVPVVGMLDRYGGITYISRNDNLATLSIQTSGSGYDGFKVQNKLSVYIEMFYIGWDTSVTP